MKTYRLIFLAGLILTLNSCKTRSTSAESPVQAIINISDAKTMNYQPLLDSINYVPLETTDQSLIGNIGKIYVTPSNILIFDSKQTAILLFDKEGKFIRKIGQKGRGPEEYLFFNEIVFERKTEIIYAHERYLNKIFKYNLKGELLEQILSKFEFNSFCKAPQGYWLYSCFKENNPKGYNLMLVDEKMQNMTAGFFPQNPAFVNTTFNSTFSRDYSGTSYFVYPTSNIIYKLNTEQPVPYFQIDFGTKNLPYEKIKKLSSSKEYDNLVNEKRYLGDISNLLCFQNYLLFSFNESGFYKPIKFYFACLNTSNSKTTIYNGYSHFLPYQISYTLLGTTEKALIYSIKPALLDENERNVLKEKNINVTIDSNPILAFFNIRTVN